MLCPFYQPNLEIRRIAHGETNTAKVDNGAKFPLKLLLLIWSRTLLFAAFCFLLYRTPIRDTESTTATGIKQEHSFLHSTKVTRVKNRERTRQHETCAATCSVGLRRYFSPGHWHCVQKPVKKNIPASQRAPVPPQCVRNERKN